MMFMEYDIESWMDNKAMSRLYNKLLNGNTHIKSTVQR